MFLRETTQLTRETSWAYCLSCNGVSALLWEMSQERTEPRRNRINPRVIKQKMSKWKKKRPEHFHPPPLTKTFAESMVMLN